MTRKRGMVPAILLVCILAGAWPLPAAEKISTDLREVIAGPRYQSAHWGVLVADLQTGETLYEMNGDKLFHPASTTKLFTTATALDAFGEAFRFQTPVYLHGEVDAAGDLQGDLILAASGDPTFGGRTTPDGAIATTDADHTYLLKKAVPVRLPATNPGAALETLARQVAAAGIKRVRGEVIIDDRLFPTTVDPYGFPRTPIAVNDNLIDFILTPSVPGAPATVALRPRPAAYQVDAEVRTAASGDAAAVEITSPGPGRFVVRGQVPFGKKPLIQAFQIQDPAGFARTLFIEALLGAGVAVEASPLGRNPADRLPAREALAGLRRVALFASPPYRETVKLVLKVSHNLGAELTLLAVAAANGKGTLEEGLSLERAFLTRLGLDSRSISLSDGKGGAYANLVSPRAVVQLLRLMAAGRDAGPFREALPILGVDGSLADAVKPDSPARGKVYAKTGTIAMDDLLNGRPVLLTKALAGYMTTSRDRQLAFALYVNHVRIASDEEVGAVGRDLARLCEIIYSAE